MRFVRNTKAQIQERFLRPLFDDMVNAEEGLEKPGPYGEQFARRTYIRTSFAYLEGHIYWLRGVVLDWYMRKGGDVLKRDIAKVTLLSDQVFKADATGRVTAEKGRFAFANWCAFVLRTATEAQGADAAKLFSHHGWKAVKDALDVRHRLTHPKRAEDMDVSEKEIENMREAHTWFLNAIRTIGREAKRPPS